jgi:hypothetical protein
MSTRRLAVAEVEGGELVEEELGSERVSYDEALTISGRDQKDFKLGDDEGWTDKTEDAEAKRVWECQFM